MQTALDGITPTHSPKTPADSSTQDPQLPLLPDTSVAWHLNWLMTLFVRKRHKQAENATNHRKANQQKKTNKKSTPKQQQQQKSPPPTLCSIQASELHQDVPHSR